MHGSGSMPAPPVCARNGKKLGDGPRSLFSISSAVCSFQYVPSRCCLVLPASVRPQEHDRPHRRVCPIPRRDPRSPNNSLRLPTCITLKPRFSMLVIAFRDIRSTAAPSRHKAIFPIPHDNHLPHPSRSMPTISPPSHDLMNRTSPGTSVATATPTLRTLMRALVGEDRRGGGVRSVRKERR